MLKYKFARRSLVRQMEMDCIKWGGYGVTFSDVGCEQGLQLVLTAILFGWRLPVPIRIPRSATTARSTSTTTSTTTVRPQR
ncbi:hypothetical protein T12_4080 [Trichinella patagoniensis]|uniref:Uncharacterized protein n=1 Tax=Trichinella patagoniensis TaxID=990121 RepID=A0A0V0Z507_9BILA|nr:hypothetical protein T12_5050 [Trichinella patagoniensis]KRY14559.1 hypothetical protein T12_4080 [Trichinella patagoniensis]